ncbi:hypothetical protein [Cognatishimia maritima]|uniref:Uncharacterized protein n=1 Tax=Cognatishimia maritima TaxID=870908 RepID=A0A1M5JNK9_9RHOB|nr:hypothetical protein [Cognatishimia maritima]SHG42172.1 hypothetical protein SAMN04488044_0733 [Cognatishimia maritima]
MTAPAHRSEEIRPFLTASRRANGQRRGRHSILGLGLSLRSFAKRWFGLPNIMPGAWYL